MTLIDRNFKRHLTNTWPDVSAVDSASGSDLACFIKKIYDDGILSEIERIKTGKTGAASPVDGIGHAYLICICSAIDSLAAFAYGKGKGHNRKKFICFLKEYFPNKYACHAREIYENYRCESTHGWFLHTSAISGEQNYSDHLKRAGGVLHLSLLDFLADTKKAADAYRARLSNGEEKLLANFRNRYREIRKMSP